MLSRRVSPRLAALVLTGALAFAVLVEGGAYYTGVREEARVTARRRLPTNYCISCHSDAHSIKVMRDKEDREGVPAIAPPVREKPESSVASYGYA